MRDIPLICPPAKVFPFLVLFRVRERAAKLRHVLRVPVCDCIVCLHVGVWPSVRVDIVSASCARCRTLYTFGEFFSNLAKALCGFCTETEGAFAIVRTYLERYQITVWDRGKED